MPHWLAGPVVDLRSLNMVSCAFLGVLDTMKITQKKRQTVEAVVAIQCDKCGRKMDTDMADDGADWCELQESLSIAFTGGYGSILGDGNQFELDLCQHCVKELLGPYLRQVNTGYEEEEDRLPRPSGV